MSMGAVRRHRSALGQWLRAALREWSGDADYERYRRRCAAQRQTPLDRGRYLAERWEERYGGASRCC